MDALIPIESMDVEPTDVESAAQSTSSSEIRSWLRAAEGARLEFKEAKQSFSFEKLVQYVVALANERGGKVILGVTDRRPRKIVGTQAFAEPGRLEAGLFERLQHQAHVRRPHPIR